MKTVSSLLAAALAFLFAAPAGRAQFPLQASLFPAEQQPGGGHGSSVAADATYVVVGAPLTDIAGVQDAGVAVVYSAATGEKVATLPNPSPASGDQFGYAVAVSGSRVLVGASYDDAGAFDAGAAYVYDLSSGTPTVPVATLNNPAPTVNGRYGTTVAISGSRVVVGGSVSLNCYDLDVFPPVPLAVPDGAASSLAMSGQRLAVGRANTTVFGVPGAGAVYVYDFTSGIPLGTETFGAPTPAFMEHFGNAVAISGTRVVVGAAQNDTGATDSGLAYVYELSPSPVTFVTVLNNPTPAASDAFGTSVGISGSRVIVGAGSDNTGAAYLYDLASATPSTPAATLNNPGPAALDYFGSAVALAGDRVVVGANGDDAGGDAAGSAYLYNPTSGHQTVPLAILTPALNPSPATNDQFGISVAISGDLMVVGAFFHDVPGATDAGAAYVYDLSSARPRVPILTLNNPSPAADDQFGISVAIDGKRVVVGAYGDDQGATNAGRAYVYDLASSQPGVPVATFNNPLPLANDFFGYAVAISGTRVVVGNYAAKFGINPNTERAYVFDVSSSTPAVPVASLISPTPGGQGGFGLAVAISGTRVLIGEPYDGVDQFGVKPGTVHVFDLNSPPPSVFVATLTNPDPRIGHFGEVLAMSGGRVVVGAVNYESTALTDGAAYVYNLDSTPPFAPEFTLHHPDTASDRLFGFSAAISGLRLVVGETRNNTGANSAGAAHVFDLGGATPLVPVPIFNPTPAFFDEFGGAVAVSANRVVVGAYVDDTLNTNQGAAYVFGAPVGPPEIEVEQPAGTPLADNVGSVSFGTVAVGQTSTRTFTVKNTGITDLTGLGINIVPAGPNEFSVTAAPTAPVAGPNGSTTFTVTFSPITAGPKNFFLHLASNDADENPFDIPLTATALTRLEAWRLFYFGSFANAGDGADNNDFDDDGLVNLLEFATLRDPTQFSPPIGVFSKERLEPPQPPIERLTLTYRRAKAAVLDGIQFRVAWTDDLTGFWSLIGEGEFVSDDGTLQEYTASVIVPFSEDTPRKRFMKLYISRP